MLTEKELQDLVLAILRVTYIWICHGQTRPDGKDCAICNDAGHQAESCPKNAFNLLWEELQ